MKNTPAAHAPSVVAKRHAWRTVLMQFYRCKPRTLLLGALMATSTTVMGCALLGISGWFITSTAIAGLSVGTALMFDVFTPSASIRLLALGRSGSRYAERLVTHDATLGVLVELRGRLFSGWSKPQAALDLALRPARMLFRLTRDLDALENLYLRIGVPVFCAFTTTLLISVFTGFIAPWLGLACFVWLCGSGFAIAGWISRKSIVLSAKHAQSLERLRARTVDLVAGQTDLLMAGELEAQRQRLCALDEKLHALDLQLNRIETKGSWLLTASQGISIAGMLLAGAWLVGQQAIAVPTATLLALLAVAAVEPFAGLRRGALETGKTWLAARRLAPALSAAAQPQANSADSPSPLAGDGIHIQNLDYRYGPERPQHAPTLQNIHLDIEAHAHVAIVGPSGCGKSTLLALIAKELTPLRGTITAPDAALLTQRTELFQDSVRGNLDLRQEGLSDAQLWQALEDAGLAHDIRQSSKGLQTWLGEGGLGLSGGQSRRLALARLFLAPQNLWLLDEPTEGLDAPTARDVLERIQAHGVGKTIVIATHLQREAALAHRIVSLQHGAIAATAAQHTFDFRQTCEQLRRG